MRQDMKKVTITLLAAMTLFLCGGQTSQSNNMDRVIQAVIEQDIAFLKKILLQKT
jgi:hypothetical protein